MATGPNFWFLDFFLVQTQILELANTSLLRNGTLGFKEAQQMMLS
jgi:hypothetical protein